MSHSIWKFPQHTFNETFEIPKDAKFLDAQEQDGFIAIWFLVDISAEQEQRTFILHGTGGKMIDLDRIEYLATIQMPSELVWHLFELKNKGKRGQDDRHIHTSEQRDRTEDRINRDCQPTRSPEQYLSG